MANQRITTITSGNINLDLSQQEQLILQAYNIVLACSNSLQYLSSALSAIPDITSEGIFKSYIGDDGDLGLYSIKGQEMLTLAEVIHQYAQDTYESFVAADKVAAIEVANLILNTNATKAASNMSKEDRAALEANKQAINDYPNEVINALMEAGEE